MVSFINLIFYANLCYFKRIFSKTPPPSELKITLFPHNPFYTIYIELTYMTNKCNRPSPQSLTQSYAPAVTAVHSVKFSKDTKEIN